MFYVSQETEINRIVAASEPPPHDTINEGNGRLIDKYSEYGTKFIRATKAQLNEKCKDFQTTLNQIARDDQKDVFSFLDEILGPLMKPRNKGPLKPQILNRELFLYTKKVKKYHR